MKEAAPYYFSGGAEVQSVLTPASDSDWLEDEIRRVLKRRAEIDKTTIQVSETALGRSIEGARLDGMRSLSPAARLRMLAEHIEEVGRRQELRGIDAHLEKLTRRHPIAAALIKAFGGQS
jgi:hypothetical protein